MNPALLKPAPTGAATLVVGGRSVFPHMTVIESLIEAPRLALKESKAEATESERGLLEHVGFARDVADRVVFCDAGQVVGEGPAERVINDPTQAFLGAVR